MNRNAKRKAAQARRNVLLVVALMLVVCVASIGGTIAWLTDKTEAVTNTFSPTGIDITLVETKQSDNTDLGTDQWSAELVPGKTYSKDPVVTVVRPTTDVDVYLFVKVEETKNEDDILQFDLTLDDENSGWTQGTETDGVPTNVWYRTVPATVDGPDVVSWKLMNGNTDYPNGCVTINENLTKEEMPAAADTPSLSFTAYAIQTHGMTSVGDAWNKVPKE